MFLGLWGDLTILAGVAELVFAACVFVYVGRLENRTPAPLGEKVGAHKAVAFGRNEIRADFTGGADAIDAVRRAERRF